ncbi:restriction endonuclease subunit S [Lactobacillus delbrueckii]|uniref:restriction endonuclease subunit S n=1 Tax=Lactobacillus delbrueckii TaxID=1584 RepID=UPI000E59DC0C|nr:restriction endonuclease subunit S [Lactobacillus delbrueckii]RHX66339.1 restriction endonuclease subunit S [Lactobacillus delbrueckii]
MVSELPLTISAQDGLISQDEFFNKKVASKDLSSYLLLHHGDFAYNKSYSNGYPFGTIKRLEKYPQGVVSSLYIAFKPNSSISSDFMAQYYESNNWHKEIYKCATEGARNHGLLNVPPSDFFATNLNIPITKSEQLKIGRLLNAVDQTITLHEEKKRQLERLKSALLQKMFADKSGYPDIRFEGFSDEWEQRKLGDVTSSYSGGTPTASTSNYYGGAIPFIRSGEISKDSTELTITEEGLNNSAAKLVKRGDILYALYGATSGEVSISRLDGAINQAILAIKPCIGYDSYLLMSLLKNEKKKIREKFLQGGQGNLSARIVKNIKLDIPSINEQTKIGCLLLQLDRTITLHDQKLNLLKLVKQSLLQNMFI